MRRIGFPSAGLLVVFSLIAVGCGSSSHSTDPAKGPVRVFSFSPPFIAALSPSTAPPNSVPFTIEVDGKNFLGDATVFWNGAPVTTTFVNSQKLLASLAPANLTLSGMVQVYVRTGGQNSNTVEFDLH